MLICIVNIRFEKLEGAGNDYVYIDCTDPQTCDQIRAYGLETEDKIRRISDRHFGVGSDGVVFLHPGSSHYDVQMKMYNSDGSYSEMCGNALRCVAFLMYKANHGSSGRIMTGQHTCEYTVQEASDTNATVTVEMGVPEIKGIERFLTGDTAYEGIVVSMANPHCVIFVDDPDAVDIDVAGPLIENDPRFPERTNVEFVSVLNASSDRSDKKKFQADGTFYQRTFERGSGETLACGSGACAVHAAARSVNRTDSASLIRLKGGTLKIEWNGQGPLRMTGPVRHVFSGVLKDL